jgi:hypothetical protein
MWRSHTSFKIFSSMYQFSFGFLRWLWILIFVMFPLLNAQKFIFFIRFIFTLILILFDCILSCSFSVHITILELVLDSTQHLFWWVQVLVVFANPDILKIITEIEDTLNNTPQGTYRSNFERMLWDFAVIFLNFNFILFIWTWVYNFSLY